MLFTEIMEACENEILIYDDFNKRAKLYIEASTNEYKQDLRELDILMVEKPDEDIKDKKDATDKKYIERLKKVASAESEKFKKFSSDIKDKVKHVVNGEDKKDSPESVLKKLLAQTTKDKSLAAKKVKYSNPIEASKINRKYQDELKKERAIFKSKKKITDEDFKRLHDIEDKADKELTALQIGTLVGGVAACIGATLLIIKAIDKETAEDKMISKVVDNVDMSMADPESAQYVSEMMNVSGRIHKNALDKLVSALAQNMANIKAAVKGEGVVPLDGVTKESTTEEISKTIDPETFVETLEREMFGVKDFTPEGYLAMLEKEIDETGTDLVNNLMNESTDEVNKESTDDEYESVEALLEAVENELFED